MLVVPTGALLAWTGGWLAGGGRAGWLVVSVLLYTALIPVVALVFVPRGRVLAAALDDAVAAGAVTGDLRAAFADPLVRGAHAVEAALVAVIVALMVLKPF
jgi:hypothetical protein